MTETEKEEKNKAAYLDLPNFWLTSRPWLMLAFIGAFIFGSSRKSVERSLDF